ncbi:MAG TPA: hypothetical protein VI230_08695, partial [Ignavibacteriaceae bacterium]
GRVLITGRRGSTILREEIIPQIINIPRETEIHRKAIPLPREIQRGITHLRALIPLHTHLHLPRGIPHLHLLTAAVDPAAGVIPGEAEDRSIKNEKTMV